jgi:large subunit ribosomal protein L23
MSILDKMTGKKAKEAKTAKGGAATSEKKASAKATDEKAKKDETKEVTKAEAAAATRGPLAREHGGDSYRILVRPLMTEKTAMQQMKSNQYTFAVAPGATKVDVARSIRDLYGVKPTKVRMVNVEGKVVRHGRSSGREKTLRKAIVSLKEGETISL